MQIEKIWSGLPTPHSIQERAKKVKGTYTEDAVVFEREKNERQPQHEDPQQSEDQEKLADQKSGEEKEEVKTELNAVPHVDLVV